MMTTKACWRYLSGMLKDPFNSTAGYRFTEPTVGEKTDQLQLALRLGHSTQSGQFFAGCHLRQGFFLKIIFSHHSIYSLHSRVFFHPPFIISAITSAEERGDLLKRHRAYWRANSRSSRKPVSESLASTLSTECGLKLRRSLSRSCETEWALVPRNLVAFLNT